MPAPAKPAAPFGGWTGPRSLRVQWTGYDPAPAPALSSWSLRHRTAAVEGGPAAGVYTTTSGIDPARLAATISDLQPGTYYEISLRGVNADGDSIWSDKLTIRTDEEETMGILQADLTEVQIGLETAAAPGTLVDATRKLPYVTASYRPMVDRETLEERGHVLADIDDIVVGRGSELVMTEVLNTETLIAALMCSLADAAPAGIGGAQRWTFTPAVTEPSGLRTATVEISATDGATPGLYDGRFGFARATALAIEASSGTARMTTTWMGRARQALANAANVAVPDRWVIPAGLFKLYIDDTWAEVGTTHYGKVRSLNWNVDPGITEAEALAGRAELDTPYYRRGRIRGGLNAVVDHDEDTTTELAHWENGDRRYIRLEASNGAAGALLRRLRIDMVGRYIDTPDVIAVDGPVHTLALNSQLRADTANNILRVEVVNGLANW